MSKRKQCERTVDRQDDAVIDISADFGGFELVKEFLHLHPIYKSVEVKSKKFRDIFMLVHIPRRQRSMRQGRPEKKAAEQDAGEQVGSNPKKARIKPRDDENDSNDSDIICIGSLGNDGPFKRLRGSTTRGRKLGELDSLKFDIHIQNIWSKLSEEKRNEFTYLGPFWFSMYTSHKEKVLSWIKKMDIFSKKYVFVPIVQWGHWFLLIFCHFGESSEATSNHRCMLLLDSMQKANSTQMEPGIRRFVFDIFKAEERPESKEQIGKLPFLIPKVPQQTDGNLCGFFILYYIHQFLESASDSFTFSSGSPNFMKEDWFTPKDVECFKELLDSMAESSDRTDLVVV